MIPDYLLGGTVRRTFTTTPDGIVPTTLAGSPAIKVYKDGGATSEQALSAIGGTLTQDLDSQTGQHLLVLDTSNTTTADFWQAGHYYSAVFTAGTCGGKTLVGFVVLEFTLELSAGAYAMRPATAGRKPVVDTDGRVEADSKKIGGTTQTGRDIGASVLLSSGTGTGQVSLTSGAVAITSNADVTAIKAQTDKLVFSTIDDTQAVYVDAHGWAGAIVGGMPATPGDEMTLTAAYDAAKTALPASSYTAPPSVALIAAGVWDLTTTGHATAGTFGAAMAAAGSAGDPWITPLPGSYADGTAGHIVGNLGSGSTPIVVSGAASILRTTVASMENALANLAATLAAETLANVANPKASYTISTGEGSQSVDWNGYRTAITAQMDALVKQIEATRKLINAYEPYIITTRGYVP